MPDRVMTGCRVVGLILAVSISQAVGADTELQTNPFIQPEGIEGLTSSVYGNARGKGAGTLELRGIMHAGTHSLADIGGSIVAIGQVVNGYTLVAVHERYVVLDKDGTRKELPVVADKGAGGNE